MRKLFTAGLVVAAGSLVGGWVVRAQTQTPTPPGPQVDRVEFPAGYRTSFTTLFTFDRPDVRQIRVVYGNREAASVQEGSPFPNNSIMVMETYRPRVDAQNTPVRDAEGRYVADALTGIFVMRKYRGYGAEYGPNRTGEWEYVSYRPDGSHVTAPRDSWTCANCHLQAGESRDWVFRRNMIAERTAHTGAVPDAVLQQYAFLPSTLRVKAGTLVTWLNDDEVDHRLAIVSGPVTEGPVLPHGRTFRARFNAPGDYDVVCRIHPAMRSRVTVEP